MPVSLEFEEKVNKATMEEATKKVQVVKPDVSGARLVELDEDPLMLDALLSLSIENKKEELQLNKQARESLKKELLLAKLLLADATSQIIDLLVRSKDGDVIHEITHLADMQELANVKAEVAKMQKERDDAKAETAKMQKERNDAVQEL